MGERCDWSVRLVLMRLSTPRCSALPVIRPIQLVAFIFIPLHFIPLFNGMTPTAYICPPLTKKKKKTSVRDFVKGRAETRQNEGRKNKKQKAKKQTNLN